MSKAADFSVGDRVTSDKGNGVIRYLGPTEFAKGVWIGVELDEKVGKNDGSVVGKRYFQCKNGYGSFVPPHRLTIIKRAATPASTPSKPSTPSSTPAKSNATPSKKKPNFAVDDRVLVGTRRGVVKFVGNTSFAEGAWLGIDLDKADGKNDGSVAGTRYFTCEPNHGLFVLEGKAKLSSNTQTPSKSSSSKTPKTPSSKSTPIKTVAPKGIPKPVSSNPFRLPQPSSSSTSSLSSTSISASDAAATKELTAKITELETQIKTLASTHASELEASTVNHTQALEALSTQHSHLINVARVEHENNYLRVDAELNTTKLELSARDAKLILLQQQVDTKTSEIVELQTRAQEASANRIALEAQLQQVSHAATAAANDANATTDDQVTKLNKKVAELTSQLTESTSSLQQSDDSRAALERQVKTLTETSTSSSNETKSMQQTIIDKDQELLSLTDQVTKLKPFEAQVALLEEKVVSMQQDLAELEKNKSELHELFFAAEKALQQSQKQTDTTAIENTEMTAKITELTTSLAHMTADNTSLTNERDTSVTQLTQLQSRFDEQRKKHQDELEQRRVAAASSGDADAERLNLQAELSSLKSELDTNEQNAKQALTSQTAESSRKICKLETDLKLSNEDVTNLNTKCATLTESLATRTHELVSAQAKIAEETSQIALLRTRVDDSANTNTTLQMTATENLAFIEAHEARITSLASDLVEAGKAVEDGKQQIGEGIRVQETLKENVETANKQIMKLETTILQKDDVISESKEELRLSQQLVSSTKARVGMLEQDVSTAASKLAQSTHELETLRSKVKETTQTTSAQAAESEAWAVQLKTTQDQLQASNKQVTDVRKLLSQVQLQLETTTAELAKANATAADELATAKSETSDVRAKLESTCDLLKEVTTACDTLKRDLRASEEQQALLQQQQQPLQQQQETLSSSSSTATTSSTPTITTAITDTTTTAATTATVMADTMEDLKATISALEERIEEQDETLRIANIQLDEARADVDEAADHESERFELLAANCALQTTLHEQTSEISQARSDLAIESRRCDEQRAVLMATRQSLEQVLGAVAGDEDGDDGKYLRLSRKLVREKLGFQEEISALRSDVGFHKERADHAEQELELGGRVVELEMELAETESALMEAQSQLEKLSGKKSAKRKKGVLELVNVRQLQNAHESLQRQAENLHKDNVKLKSTLEQEQIKLDHLEAEMFGLRKRLKLRKPGSGDGDDDHLQKSVKRTYCDECEIFDKHTTENCPTMNRLSAPMSASQERAYCDNCEEFGHTEDDCPEADEFY